MTGVDLVEKALARARERIAAAGVEMRLVRGDVTALRAADVGGGFRLVLDTGTFHGLGAAEQEAMGREVSAVAAPDATVLLDCFAPRRRGPLPRGASRAAVEAAFPGWEVTDVEVADSEPDALARLFKFDERFYRLRRCARADAALRGPAPRRLRLHRRSGQLAGVLARPDPRAAGIALAGAGGSGRRRDAAARPPRRAAR